MDHMKRLKRRRKLKKLLVYGDKIQQTVESIETTTVILNLSYFFFSGQFAENETNEINFREIP